MNPCELTACITAIANSLACKLSADELNVLGAVLTQLGDTLTTNLFGILTLYSGILPTIC